MNALQAGQYESIDEYMRSCYEIGYTGAMYDLAGQGMPLIMPIDEKQVVTAMYVNSKISKRLYAKLGEDVEALKKKIASTLSRGIATADSYANIARNIASDSNVGFNRAMRITRTEGHRVQAQSAMDVCYKARDAGADIVKQWDATLDGRTRLSHRMVDGEIKELEEPFSNGLMYPGDPNGSAAEVINCRCALMQRAKRALDEDELETLKERAAFFGLDKTENFNEYKRKYLKAFEKAPSVKNTVETAVKKVAPTKTVIKAKKIANVKGQVNGKAAKVFGAEQQKEFDDLKKKYKSLEEVMLFGSSEEAQKYKSLQKLQATAAHKDDFKALLSTQNISKQTLNSWHTHPTKLQESAMGSYGRNEYTTMNGWLRSGGYIPDQVKAEVNALKEFLECSKIKSEIYLKRGTDFNAMRHLLGDDWQNNLNGQIGKRFTEKGFFSTSPYEDGGFGGDVVLYIKAPAGTKGAYIDDYVPSDTEKEFLIAPNTQLEVKRIEKTTNKYGNEYYNISVEVIVSE